GFAVVANEVRNLAQRCAQSAHEIRDLITDTTGKINDGARLAEQGRANPAWQQHMVWLLVLVAVIVCLLLAARGTQLRRRREAARKASERS
ncbi:hypothetical protein HF319_12885, partial [Xanthomonas sp. Kuri4-1]